MTKRKHYPTPEEKRQLNKRLRSKEHREAAINKFHEWLEKQIDKKGDKYFEKFGTF